MKLGGLFSIGVDELAYPGDPSGDAAEVVNCNCQLALVRAAPTPIVQRAPLDFQGDA